MPYKVKLKELLPQKIMYQTLETDAEHLADDLREVFGDLHAYLVSQKAPFIGTRDAIFKTALFNEQKIVIDCAFGVHTFVPETNRFKARLDEGGLMAATVHQGSYDKLAGAYAAVMKWMDENGYGYTALKRNRYINNPNEVPPQNLLTEIYWPVSLKK